MEDLFAQERNAEHHVHKLLKRPDEPIGSVLQAFEQYRHLCQACVFADFKDAEKRESRLWLAHTEGKRYFHSALSKLRKQGNERVVETRQLTKLFLLWIKSSTSFYRLYIAKLNATYGGIPELEAVAHQVKADGVDESPHTSVTPELHAKVLMSCHQSLIYLGDLSRYRASEQLDKKPDFGPAMGYYSLACALRPSSGMGDHQQAVIALEQRHHLRAIYHLYRAIVVSDPHPNAAKNLKLEFDKVNTAWDKGELIRKCAPNDPDGPKNSLVGWFIRLHSICFKGDHFRGYEELERELLSQFAAVVKQPAVEGLLLRMVLVNLAAQYKAIEAFQRTSGSGFSGRQPKLTSAPDDPTLNLQQSFLYYFRINIRMFTTLLQIFAQDLRSLDGLDLDEENLATKLAPLARRLLPSLRLYSVWVIPAVHIISGLASDAFLRDAVTDLWSSYAAAIDIVAEVFPIWDLEDVPVLEYMLEEDAETLGFKPLESEKTTRNWIDAQTGLPKPRFSDRDVARLSPDAEMLARVKDFLSDGLYLANDDEEAPIKLDGVRIHSGSMPQGVNMPQTAARRQQREIERAARIAEARKPLSYAAAAAKSSMRPVVPTAEVARASSRAQQARLSRMVDDLVDDDDGNNPITPPQQHIADPAVVTNGEVSYPATGYTGQDFVNVPSYQPNMPSTKTVPPASAAIPALRTPKNSHATHSAGRLQSVSGLWNESPGQSSTSPSFPAGLPMGTLSSPAQMTRALHSRVNSASSIRSRTSQNIGDSWSSLESAPRAINGVATAADGYGQFSASAGIASPLLFGAGGGMWSAVPAAEGHRGTSPPNGQGG